MSRVGTGTVLLGLVLVLGVTGCKRAGRMAVRKVAATAAYQAYSDQRPRSSNAAAPAVSASASTAPPGYGIRNVFEPKEWGSTHINGILTACMRGANGSKQAIEQHVKGWFCVCVADAALSKVPESRDDEVLRVCEVFARGVTPSMPVATRTPYTARSVFNSNQIAGAFQGCVRGATSQSDAEQFTSVQIEAMCSCLVDEARLRGRFAEKVSEALSKTCLAAAKMH